MPSVTLEVAEIPGVVDEIVTCMRYHHVNIRPSKSMTGATAMRLSTDVLDVLEALLLLLLQQQQEFVDGLLHLLLVRSGTHVFFIMRVWGRLRRRWVWNVPSSFTMKLRKLA